MARQELQPIWIDTPQRTPEVAAACREAGRFALDTEADSLYSYFHKVCLIQVSAGQRHFLLDPLALGSDDLAPLLEVVADPSLPVVMHGADYDIRVLDRDFDARVSGLLDTQIMGQLLGEQRTGLSSLLSQELGLRISKRLQRANWGRRPLPDDLLQYAAADTAFLEQLALRLQERLQRLGRWSWVVEDCSRLESVRYTVPDSDPLAFERLKGARRLKGAARDRCCSLHRWREQVAQELDLPPFKILGNEQLLRLADEPPADNRQLASVKGITPRFIRRWGKQVLARVQQPEPAPARERRPQTPRLSQSVRTLSRRLLEERDAVAAELAIDPGILCPKALAAEVAAVDPATGPVSVTDLERCGLVGWRLHLLGERFLTLLRE